MGDPCQGRQIHDFRFGPLSENLRYAGCDLAVFVRRSVIAAQVEFSDRIAVAVKDPRDACQVDAAGSTSPVIDGHLHGLKDVAETVVFVMPDGVVGMIVALDTGHRDAQKGFCGVLNRVANPLFAAIGIPVANQEAGGTQIGGIERHELVGSQHFHQHSLVAFIGVE